MVIKYIPLLILLISATAYGQAVEEAFKRKDYHRVTALYLSKSNAKKKWKQPELVMIGFSFQKQDKLRQANKLYSLIIKNFYLPLHWKLIKAVKNQDEVDGDDYPQPLKMTYLKIYQNVGNIIQKYKKESPELTKDFNTFQHYRSFLESLEFKERDVERMNDAVLKHLQDLKDKIYAWKKGVFVDYISWQRDITLNKPDGTSTLILTNRGVCAGGYLSFQNKLWSWNIDGCVLSGHGGISSSDPAITYQQSKIPAYGLKLSPSIGRFVSSTQSEVGFKIPIFYTSQKLQDPGTSGYSVKEDSALQITGSLYSRWRFGQWFFQTEYGKYISQDSIFWSLGGGYQF